MKSLTSVIVNNFNSDSLDNFEYVNNYSTNNKINFEKIVVTNKEDSLRKVEKYDLYIERLIKKNILKSFSFVFTETTSNSDENINKSKLIGNCEAFYSYYLFINSSEKKKSVKQHNTIKTDIILRDYFKMYNVYEKRKNIFENTAYKNLIDAIKNYHQFSDELNKEAKKFHLKRLKLSFKKIDKIEILKDKKTYKYLYQKLLLSNFLTVFFYYKFNTK